MSEITLKAIEKLLDEKFNKQISPIHGEIRGIKTGMSNLATNGELQAFSSRFDSIESTLTAHTAALEQLLTEKKNRDEEKIVNAERFERLEHWAVLAGKKLGIKLEL